MAKQSWISNLLAATVIAVILVPIIYAKPQGPFDYYGDNFPKSQQRRRVAYHPVSVKYHNEPAYSYGYGHRDHKSQPNPEARISPAVPNSSQKPKEVFVYLDERPYAQGKSLEPRSDGGNIFDAQKNQTSTGVPKLPQDKDTLPREHSAPPVQRLGKTRPSCAKEGQVFCTEIDTYPSDVLEKILRSSPEKYQEAFGDDVPNTIVTRVDVRIDADEETLCDSEEKVIHPKVGLTIDNEYEYIVNFANFTQGIRVEECKNINSACKMTNNFPNGYKTECKQKFIYRNLLGYGKEGRVEKNLYQFPSCCQCVLKPNYSK